MLTNAFVNCKEQGKDEPIIVVPKCIAVPLDRLAKQLGRVPMFDYAVSVINNWKLKDQT